MKILIADDEAEPVEIIKESLSKKGYVVDAALDGKAALDLIKKNNYDIVFLDHNMPELTGLELIKYIKENNLDTKTVMITGYPHMAEFAAKDLGADEYLAKPFKMKEIDDIIDKYKKMMGGRMTKKRILVVDDETELVKAVQIRLEQAGYEVLFAYDGQEGLDKARKEKPDLIILDLMLPKIDGYKVCRMLKFDEKFKQIPIILLTARAQESDKKMGEDVGADVYITKPFESQAILEKIKELIQ